MKDSLKILGIDTSGDTLSVAVFEKLLIKEIFVNTGKTHSQTLMPYVDELLMQVKLDISQIDLIGVVTGPGSFTGLRIGVSTAKAFAQALQIPIAGINTLDALAANALNYKGYVCPIIDARNGDVYTALFDNTNGTMVRIGEYRAVAFNSLTEELAHKDVIFSGTGALKFFEQIHSCGFSVADESLNFVHAEQVCSLANSDYLSGNLSDYLSLEVFYLRASQAERLRLSGGSI